MSHPIPALSDELKTQLEMSDVIVNMECRNAFSCRLALYVVQWTYYNSKNREKLFFNNPMNTMGATLLKSTLEKSALNAYSEISEFIKKAGLKWSYVIGLDELQKHRHFQAHSYLGEFSNEKVQAFIEADQHYKDDIALRLWQVRCSLIQLKLKNKVAQKNPIELPFGAEMAELTYNVFKYSCRDMGSLSIGTIESTVKMFAMVLTADYALKFQQEFSKEYSEGPFVM